ncbi:MAG: anti-sigma factor family protein [Bacteroidota bacterium]
MNNPTYQELLSYVDGMLDPERRREIEHLITLSSSLRKEIEIIAAMNTAIRQERVTVSHRFTDKVMSDVLPRSRETLWYRMVKNSSNVVALVIVISIIIFSLMYTSADTPASQSVYIRQLETLSSSYNQFAQEFTERLQQVLTPIGNASATSSGKLVALGTLIFFFYVVIDGALERRLRIRK